MNAIVRPHLYDWLVNLTRDKVESLKASGRTATEREIAEQLALLLKAYPNAGSADGEIFGAMLIEDVVGVQPSIGDIQEACRYLRRTSKFLPTISEVLDSLVEAREYRECMLGSIGPAAPAISRAPPPQIEHQQTVNVDLSELAPADLLPL